MSFTSIEFIAFLAVLIPAYYIVPQKCQTVLLLAASYWFYLSGGVSMVWYLLFTTLSTYGAGLLLGRMNEAYKALSPRRQSAREKSHMHKKQLVVSAVCIANFGLLYVLKYWDFTASAISGATGGAVTLPQFGLLMPLGVSFYMFQSIGYVIDCHRGKHPPEKNPLKFALFVSFFPQIIQGPISRYSQLGGQLEKPHAFDADQLKYGIQLTMWGYFKKLVIADRAAIVANAVFADPDAFSGAVIAFGVLFYCIQLYCDFSGGIDITRGVAQMLGIELIENFRRPLFALSLAEYWRRWHISLGQWMKDYVFYSLTFSRPFIKLGKFTRRRIGGKLGKVIPTSLATFIIYFIIGIWHSADFRYIFYGLWNGTVITSSLLLAGPYNDLRKRLKISDRSRGLKYFRMARTWLLVFMGRYITRAPRLMTAFSMLWATITRFDAPSLFDGTVLTLGLPVRDLWIVGLCMAVVLAVEYAQEQGIAVRKWLEQRPAFVQWLCIAVPLTVLLLLGIMRGSYISSEFIYKQF